jgi:hypothetical protein
MPFGCPALQSISALLGFVSLEMFNSAKYAQFDLPTSDITKLYCLDCSSQHPDLVPSYDIASTWLAYSLCNDNDNWVQSYENVVGQLLFLAFCLVCMAED